MSMPAQKPGRSVQEVETPDDLLVAVRSLIGIPSFTLDLAANGNNAKASWWLGPGSAHPDALAVDWIHVGWGWLNPPFSKIAPFLQKAAEAASAGSRIAALVPASVGSEWWAAHVHGHARALALRPRVTFVGHKDPYPKDLALLLYDAAGGTGIHPWRWK